MERENHVSRPICLLVTLDVKNAFNSVKWTDALGALERDFRVPEYLRCMIGNYLNDRFLVYETRDGLKRKEITSGAAQDSVLGPEIWLPTYDRILRMEMPEGTFLIGYADNIAAVIMAWNVELAQMRLDRVMRRICERMKDHGPALAVKSFYWRKKCIPLVMEMHVGDAAVTIGTSVHFLGVTLDNRLAFGSLIRRMADKAARVTTALSRIVANTVGPKPCKRHLLIGAPESVILYEVEVWADAMNTDMDRKRIVAIQRRGTLRITSSYSTVSGSAVLVIAGVFESFGGEKTKALEEIRVATMRAWCERREHDTSGR